MKNKFKLAQIIIIKSLLYGVIGLSVFLLLSSVLSGYTVTLTVNWVEAFIGIILFLLTVKLYKWLFQVKRDRKGDNDDRS